MPNNTDWVGNVSKTRLSIQSDADAKRVCPVVCSSAGAGRPTGRWRKQPLQVIQGNQYQGLIGYYDSSCECQKIAVLKRPGEYDYKALYANNPAYNNLGKNATEYAAIVRAFNAKHRQEAIQVYNQYGRFEGVPEESRLGNINSDEAQRFLRANKNIYKAYEGGTLDEAKPGWLTLNQAEAIIRKEIPRPPHYQPAYGEPGYKRGEYVHIKEGIK